MGLSAIAQSQILESDKVFHTTPVQDGFMFSEAKHPAFVASWGTGKSFTAIQRGLILSEESPGNLGVIFRRQFTDLRDSTLKDFELYTGIKINSDRSVTLANGSTILFRHLEEMHGTMQNMNLGWFWIEQAEELETDTQFFVLHGRLRRNVKRRSGFITANTNGKNWIHRLWKANKGSDPDYPLFEANSLDSAHYLPADTIADWKKLETKAPKMFHRFVMNSWEESDTTDVIIQPEWIRAACSRSLNIIPPFRRVVSIDVSRYGDDKTVCYALENNVWKGVKEWEKKSTMETVGRAVLFAKEHDCESFAVDEIGVGGGVADRLEELEYDVVRVNASEKDPNLPYYNRRAEIHLYAADLLENGQVQLSDTDHDLNEQLSWAKYRTIKSNGVYQVEAKEDIKERYGRSPDNADAFMNGLWALPRVDAKRVIKRDKYERAFERMRQPVGSGMSI
jgi:hypothetical protein